ncbi:MAG: PD40 domain-containing protein [Acidobacteria bacterium]|nr:PD40 domain-containing protein [Acidobacteriota bacterium]MBI3657544.1 PD40 domain-containing protein [Acidobacteriota bacterium]
MFSLPMSAQTEARLMRFPDIHGERVAFVYAGDLWVASTRDGMARRLTTHKGLELFPKFSPDGQWLAFSAEYDGNRDVYIVPADGGEPRRLTYSPDMGGNPSERMGYDNIVMGWTPDSQRILYRSRRESFSPWAGKLHTISKEGGVPESLPLPRGGFTSFSPDGKKIAYNRVFREFRTWKHYRGGQADDVWIYDLQSGSLENISQNPAQDIIPMWRGQKIYYVSDRDHTANIFAYDLSTKQTKKLTNYTEYDVKFPSAGPQALVYENGGYLYKLDFETEQIQKLTIQVHDDRVLARPEYVSVNENITEFDLSPDGQRALFVARGELFTVPAEKGNTRNLTNTSGAREKSAVWSPDGKWIAYISDATGEDEIYVQAQDGRGQPRRITHDGQAFRFSLVWSRDSKMLLSADKNLRLYYVDLDTQKTTEIDKNAYGEITMYSWSPDGRWVAYAKPGKNSMNALYLYSLEQKKIFPITNGFTVDWNPVFDPEGKYLYFLSNRDFNPTLGAFELSFTYTNMTRPYVVTLAANAASPLAPQSDEVKSAESQEKPGEAAEEKKDGKTGTKKDEKSMAPKPIQIDTDRIGDRIVALPIAAGNYSGLRAAKGKLFYIARPQTGKPTLKMFDMEKRKENELLPAENYDLAASGEKIIYRNEKTYAIVDAKPAAKPGEGALNLSGLKMKLDRRAEWKQIFDEAWRMERDYFYAANLHGVDWTKMRERFSRLLPFVSHRADLTYLIGEMIAELNASHAYVGGGDAPTLEKVTLGQLGADLELDPQSRRYRIKRILQGQNWTEDRRSPLTEAGINVKEGEYVLAIDGKELQAPTNPYSLLENTVGKTVTLTVGRPDELGNGREVIVRPIAGETGLRYYNWVEANRRYVEKATGGKVGYLHIPDMGIPGLNEFVKYFYPQIDKEGLIVDVRYNGGGFVSQMIIERLRRVLTGMSAPRNWTDTTYPRAVFVGPMVCLLNEFSSSDGDIFPYQFRVNKLGPLIGKRSWGGVVGIRGNIPLIDGGYITRPEFANYSADGRWVMEGEGVTPDIEVDNPPLAEFNGQDAQLDRAIQEVLERMKTYSVKRPPRPPEPVKN